MGPDKRYSYKFDYGFFLVRPGSGGGYMLGVEPPGPTTAANPSYFTSCRLTYKQELKIKNNTLPGWVYEATQFRENGRVNNPNPYRYFFIASQDNGNGKFYIGFSDTPGDPIKFENNTYKDETAQTAIDG